MASKISVSERERAGSKDAPPHNLPYPVRAITVAEFCEWAHLDRSSFYNTQRKHNNLPRLTRITGERTQRILPHDFRAWLESVQSESDEPERKAG